MLMFFYVLLTGTCDKVYIREILLSSLINEIFSNRQSVGLNVITKSFYKRRIGEDFSKMAAPMNRITTRNHNI